MEGVKDILVFSAGVIVGAILTAVSVITTARSYRGRPG